MWLYAFVRSVPTKAAILLAVIVSPKTLWGIAATIFVYSGFTTFMFAFLAKSVMKALCLTNERSRTL